MLDKVSAEEVARFSALAPKWWDEDGPMRPLHRMNRLRVRWITQRIRQTLRADAKILDLGCGGGIASEALAQAGFLVTGVDASEEAIGVARTHAAEAGLGINYRVGLADDLLAEGDGIELDGFDIDLAGFDLGEVEEVVDEVKEGF